MIKGLKILLLEDSQDDVFLIQRELSKAGISFTPLVVNSKEEFKDALHRFGPDLILSDHSLPEFNSVEALKIVKEEELAIPFILVTGTVSEEFAADIIKKGAWDYILKDRMQRLPAAVINAIEKKQLEDDRTRFYQETLNNGAMLLQTERLACIGSWDADLINGTMKWSAEQHRLLGYEPGNITPSLENFLARVHPEDVNRVTKKLKTAVQRRKPLTIDFRIELENGSTRYMHSKFLVQFNDKKIPTHMLGFSQDVTDMKLAELERIKAKRDLQAAHERLLFHLENSPLGFIEWNNKLLIKSWSRRAEEIFGWTEKECLDTRSAVFSQVHEEDVPKAKKTIEELLIGAVNRNKVQLRNYTKDGKVIWCEWFNSVLRNRQKKVITIMSLVQDITERKQAESMREKITTDLVHKNKDLEQFTYIVSHNLRAPVANIIGLCDIFQHAGKDEETKLKVNEHLSSSAKKLDTIIKDLNLILQVRNEVNEHKTTVRFSDVLNNVKASLGNWLTEENVQIQADFSEINELFTLKSYLQSIFFNLISNSIKYRQAGRPALIEIRSFKENGKTVLVFKDNGIGIDLEKYGHQLFRLYSRFHKHTEGKGMGLFMVKTQVEMLGATIHVASKVNEGTTFTIKFTNASA